MAAVIDVIAGQSARIVERWADDAAASPSAQGLGRSEVIDNVPRYLETLVARLGGHEAANEPLELHVGVRLRQGYELADTMAEYTLLGRHIVQACLEGGVADLSGLERVFAELHRAQSILVQMYTRHLLEDEQSEKRYLRLLDQIASEAAERQSPAVSARLGAFIRTIARGLDAPCGCLFLLDDEQRLAFGAEAGGCIDPSTFPPQPLDATSFLAQVARDGSLHAFAPGEVQLATPGPHAIAGVSLHARGRLLGVVCIGYHDRPQVSLRQQRRLEVLARRLALLLDNGRLHDELQARVHDLQEERDLRDRFVSVLAHDLRGPLSAAKVSAELLAEHAVDDQLRNRLVERVVRGIERTDRMVRDMLDASRVRAGQPLPIRREACDLTQVAADAIEEVTAVYGDRFVLQGEPGIMGWFGAGELRRAIANLAANGAKYGAPDGRVTVSVRATGNGAEVRVHNDGPPMSEEVKRRLFKPFSQAKLGRGWGLGLTLVAGAAQAHGGSVSVDSNTHGTTFTLSLPLQPEAELHV